METTHTSDCSIRSAVLSLSSESTTKTTVTEQRRQTTTAMSVNFILEVKRAGDANGDDVIQRKLPTQIVIPSSSSSGHGGNDESSITLQTVLQSLDESQIPLFLWNTDRVEFAYKVKLEDQFNINANTWAVPLTGVPIERVVNIEEDCIVVRPLSSTVAAQHVT